MKSFYEPTLDHLAKLNGPWCASFSGGKDSTSLVTWVEWLRREGWVSVDRPQLVQSDTGVEEANLADVSRRMMDVLGRRGWECAIVKPETRERLYVQILGRGLPSIHPGVRRMRWCTRSTKIDPMNRWRESNSSGLCLTGLRFGESAMRDGKIKKPSCAAGGECGIPDASERTYSPIIEWKTCQVVDWLNGAVPKRVGKGMTDIFGVTRKLVEIYGVRIGQPTFEFAEPEIKAARYGCRGCPAIGAEATPPQSVVHRNGVGHPFNELYGVWHFARKKENRLCRVKDGKLQLGPIRLAVRPVLFARVMDIQQRAGVVLVTPDDEAFIRMCWEKKVYPRGWSEADESTIPPSEIPLYESQT